MSRAVAFFCAAAMLAAGCADLVVAPEELDEPEVVEGVDPAEAEVDPDREEAWGEATLETAFVLPYEAVELDAVSDEELALEDEVEEQDMSLPEGEAPILDIGPEEVDEPPTVLEANAQCPQSRGAAARHYRNARLRTTDWLNLRTGPGISNSRITVMPPGARVTVLRANCGADWIHIRDPRGREGWSAVRYLRASGSPPPASTGGFPSYSAQRGARLARKAWSLYRGHRSGGMCLRGVGTSLRASIAPGLWTYTPGAHQFGVYARTHKGQLARAGLKVVDSGIPRGSSFPKGTVMVWSRGRCGFHPTWGHVEIVVNDGVACSDFCRRRTDSSCAPSVILYPTVR